MDPTALWKMLCEALHELEQSPENRDLRAHVIDMLEVLARWLHMGGFPPAIPTKETQ
jgi:hypothetical protein